MIIVVSKVCVICLDSQGCVYVPHAYDAESVAPQTDLSP